jgi:hypothetical protein
MSLSEDNGIQILAMNLLAFQTGMSKLSEEKAPVKRSDLKATSSLEPNSVYFISMWLDLPGQKMNSNHCQMYHLIQAGYSSANTL